MAADVSFGQQPPLSTEPPTTRHPDPGTLCRAARAEGYHTEDNVHRGPGCSGDALGAPDLLLPQPDAHAGRAEAELPQEEREAGLPITNHFGEGSLYSGLGCPLCTGPDGL